MSDIESLLAAYADGELDVEGAQRAEQLLATDPRARHLLEIYRETDGLLRAACGESAYAAGSDKLLPPLKPSGLRVRRRAVWAIAASVALGIVGAGGAVAWWRGRGSELDSLIDEIAEYHAVYSRETKHLVEVSADQTPEALDWLGRRLERSLTVPDLSEAGLHFAGARMLVVDRRPVAQFMYTREHGLPIAVCIAQMEGGPAALRIDRRGIMRLASWQDGAYAYVVVGELGEAAVRYLADRVADQLKT